MKTRLRKWAVAIGVALILVAAGLAVLKLSWTLDESRAPESATGRRSVAAVHAQTAMAVTAHPLATATGVEVLKAGGNALDAAIAVQAVLTLVEPQSSGLGGGAFLLYYDHASRKLHAYDGRETAPAQSPPTLFMHPDGTPYDMVEAIVGGRSVGVPGVLRALELAHRKHGKLPWRALFQPAIRLSEDGFDITPRLNKLVQGDALLRTMPAAREYFYDSRGRAKAVGTRLRNPALAQTLRRIADDGADAFYRGPIARDIVDAVQRAVRPSSRLASANFTLLKLGAPYGTCFMARVPNPGFLSEQDLADYQAREREPICRPYRAQRVCGFGPPSSGGVAVLQTLALLERFELGKNHAINSADALHLIAQAERLAYADRDRYVADVDFVAVPLRGLLDSRYLAARSQLIDPMRDHGPASPGLPEGADRAMVDGVSPELPSTSHFSIVDAQRNAVSITTSIEYAFGSHVMVDGFLLNNQLTDFSFNPGTADTPMANALAPGKRPRSSMAPMMVFDAKSGEPRLAVGSPGGSRIIGYVVRALLGSLEWGLDPQQAVALPHALNRNGVTELENEGWGAGELQSLTQQLSARGHTVSVTDENSGLHTIAITPEGLVGGVDPRREGLAAGW